jgi:glucose/arabinose dehydrogenase
MQKLICLALGLSALAAAPLFSGAATFADTARTCPDNESGISLPKRFCATVFADKVGHARQMVVAPDGTVYLNTWSGVYYGNDKPQGCAAEASELCDLHKTAISSFRSVMFYFCIYGK